MNAAPPEAEAVTTDSSNSAELKAQLQQLQRRCEDQARKLVALELAQRAAEDEARKAKEELSAHRQVDNSALERRVEEAVLKALASEVAKRRRLEHDMDRLRDELSLSEKRNGELELRVSNTQEQMQAQETRFKVLAKQEVANYKKAAKAAWQGAEEEVARLENEIVRLRQDNELLSAKLEAALGRPVAVSGPPPTAPGDLSEVARSAVSEEISALKEKLEESKSSREKLQDVYGPYVGEGASVNAMDVPTIDDAPVAAGFGRRAAAVTSSARKISEAPDLFDQLDHLEKVEGSKASLKAYIDPTADVDLGSAVLADGEDAGDDIEDSFAVSLPKTPAVDEGVQKQPIGDGDARRPSGAAVGRLANLGQAEREQRNRRRERMVSVHTDVHPAVRPHKRRRRVGLAGFLLLVAGAGAALGYAWSTGLIPEALVAQIMALLA